MRSQLVFLLLLLQAAYRLLLIAAPFVPVSQYQGDFINSSTKASVILFTQLYIRPHGRPITRLEKLEPVSPSNQI